MERSGKAAATPVGLGFVRLRRVSEKACCLTRVFGVERGPTARKGDATSELKRQDGSWRKRGATVREHDAAKSAAVFSAEIAVPVTPFCCLEIRLHPPDQEYHQGNAMGNLERFSRDYMG